LSKADEKIDTTSFEDIIDVFGNPDNVDEDVLKEYVRYDVEKLLLEIDLFNQNIDLPKLTIKGCLS
jgi:hypothetical protein